MDRKEGLRLLPCLTLCPLLVLPAFASAQVDWSAVPDLSDSDKVAIAGLVEESGMGNPGKVSMFRRLPSSDKVYLFSTPVIVDGLRRSWREAQVCRIGESTCQKEPDRRTVGKWKLDRDFETRERWRFSGDDWFVDVELGSAISYAEANTIIAAIHDDALTGVMESRNYSSALHAASFLSIRTLDPIAGEFQVSLSSGGGGHHLKVRLRGDEVELLEVLMVTA